MFTLKIYWARFEKEGPIVGKADESTHFVEADKIVVHGEINSSGQMEAWDPDDYFDYHVEGAGGEDGVWRPSRIIEAAKDGKSTWYLASHAWILGPDGKTIERLV